MGPDDLQLLIVQKPDDKLDLLIYDPMPGGSGLLEQMLARWQELIATAKELLAGCVQGCETACYSCLKTFRNQFQAAALDEQGPRLQGPRLPREGRRLRRRLHRRLYRAEDGGGHAPPVSTRTRWNSRCTTSARVRA